MSHIRRGILYGPGDSCNYTKKENSWVRLVVAVAHNDRNRGTTTYCWKAKDQGRKEGS